MDDIIALRIYYSEEIVTLKFGSKGAIQWQCLDISIRNHIQLLLVASAPSKFQFGVGEGAFEAQSGVDIDGGVWAICTVCGKVDWMRPDPECREQIILGFCSWCWASVPLEEIAVIAGGIGKSTLRCEDVYP